jgi:hypothetical protein
MNNTPIDRYAAVKADKKRRKEESKRRASRNPFSEALSVACDQCGIKYRAIPAPRNLAEFNLVTSPVALTSYQDRQRRDNVSNSYEVVTEDDGRTDSSGNRQEWVILAG